jgi:hypothetical protein
VLGDVTGHDAARCWLGAPYLAEVAAMALTEALFQQRYAAIRS